MSDNFRFTKLLNAMVNPLDVQAQRDADKELQAVERGKQTGGFVIPPDAVASHLTVTTGGRSGAFNFCWFWCRGGADRCDG